MIKLMQGDCLEEMKKIESGSIDMILTSPPYDNLRTYNGNLKWGDEIWRKVIVELFRVIKDGGVLVWVVGDATINGSETGTSFKQALFAVDYGFNLHDTMIYEKQNPVPCHHNRYQPCFEYMFILSKNRPRVFNPIKIKCERHEGKGGQQQILKDGTKRKFTRPGSGNRFKYKKSIWTYSIGGQRNGHPAVFPQKLAEDHIISWSNKGDLVLDPFMGSGSTGVACMDLSRDFIGIELDEKYFALAKDRMDKHNVHITF